jgi:hypothetical protein
VAPRISCVLTVSPHAKILSMKITTIKRSRGKSVDFAVASSAFYETIDAATIHLNTASSI